MHQPAGIHLSPRCDVLVGSDPYSQHYCYILDRQDADRNIQLALVSMLLLNFVDVQIQWSIQVLAMSLWDRHICVHYFLRTEDLLET